METELFVELAIILGGATCIGVLLHFLKQPLVAAYILAGVLISFLQIGNISTHGPLEFLPAIGVAFLLFLIGIELDFRELRSMGKSIVLASIAQMAITTALVSLIMTTLGFAFAQALLIGIAISFSSTIVVIKLLLDKQEITTLHGRVAIGILLLEDIVAIVALMFLSLSNSVFSVGLTGTFPAIALFIKGLILVVILFLLIKFVIGRLFALLAKNTELLFLSAIAWCFLFISFARLLGFSLEIGAFLGGVTLAASPYRYQIAGRLKPLRDFFIAIFFIDLGMSISYPSLVSQIGYIALFSSIALIIKPLEFMGILSLLGFRRYTTYNTATALSQISEFSVILFVAAKASGIIDSEMVSIMAATTVVTIFISSLLVNQNARLYKVFKGVVGKLERDVLNHVAVTHKDLVGHTILIGANRAGEHVLDFLKKKVGDQLLVVDYNPEIVKTLKLEDVNTLFGDIADPDVHEQLNLGKATLVISTIREMKENLLLLQTAKRFDSGAIFIMAAQDDDEAAMLYENGAHEVIVPLSLEAIHIVRSLSDHWGEESYFIKNREKHIHTLHDGSGQ